MLIGGWAGTWSSLLEIYSIDEGFFAELPSMPTARLSFSDTSEDSNI